MTRVRGISAALLAAAAIAGPAAGAAEARLVRTVEAGERTVRLSVGSSLEREDGRRLAIWQLESSAPVPEGATEAVGPALAVDRQKLAERGRVYTLSGGTECDGAGGGAAFVYGTVSSAVGRVVLRTREGRRVRLKLEAPPERWRFAGRVASGERAGRYRPTAIVAYGRDGRRLAGGRFRDGANCAPAPGEPEPILRRIDPSIRSGAAQRALDRAQRRWARAGIDDYALRTRLVGCFCFDRPEPVDSVVTDGRPARRGGATVPRLFRAIQRAIDREASELDVSYGRYGVPEEYYEDPEDQVTDEQYGVRVSRFRVR